MRFRCDAHRASRITPEYAPAGSDRWRSRFGFCWWFWCPRLKWNQLPGALYELNANWLCFGLSLTAWKP